MSPPWGTELLGPRRTLTLVELPARWGLGLLRTSLCHLSLSGCGGVALLFAITRSAYADREPNPALPVCFTAPGGGSAHSERREVLAQAADWSADSKPCADWSSPAGRGISELRLAPSTS